MSHHRTELTNEDVDFAFAKGEFALVFQPKFDLWTGEIRGAEAFVRWYHHRLGDLPRGVFLSYLKRQGRMAELTRFVIDRSLQAAAAWHAEGFRWPVHIRLGADDLDHDGFVRQFKARLDQAELPANTVRFVMTEDDLNALSREGRTNLHNLLAIGTTLAAQGPAKEAYRDTDELPIAEFQLRGTALLTLAAALSEGQSGRILGMIRAAKRLGRETTAIALETEHHAATARDLEFDSATGYAFARPMALEDLLYWAVTHQPEPAAAIPAQAV